MNVSKIHVEMEKFRHHTAATALKSLDVSGVENGTVVSIYCVDKDQSRMNGYVMLFNFGKGIHQTVELVGFLTYQKIRGRDNNSDRKLEK